MKHLPVILLGICLLLSAAPASVAQRILLQANVADDTIHSSFGPNRAWFSHFYFGYAAVVGSPAGPGAPLHYGRSGDIFLGIRNKRRLTQTLAVGVDTRYNYLTYHLAQTNQKSVPTATLHKREYLALHQVQAEPFVRFNLGRRRGNAIGRYFDLAGWGGWALGTTHGYEDAATATARRVKTTERGLSYLNRWSYGASTRLGTGHCALVGRYRFSDTFKGPDKVGFPELPRWQVGLEVGWF